MLNRVRAIFSGGGGGVKCLLTATVAALLLAAPAEAQTVSFSATTGVVNEDTVYPVSDRTLARHFRVTVTKTGTIGANDVTLISTPAFDSASVLALRHGLLRLELTAVPTARYDSRAASPTTIRFNAQNQAVLVITQGDDFVSGQNWKDEEITLALQAPAGTTIGPPLKLSLKDRHATPTATFSKTAVRLTEDSSVDGAIKLEYPAGATLPNVSTITVWNESGGMGRNRLRIKVDPPDGIGTGVGASFKPGPVEFTTEGQGVGAGDAMIRPVDGMPGMFTLPVTVWEAGRANGAPFVVKARPDQAGFRSPKVTISFIEFETVLTGGAMARVGTPGGPIKAGPPLVVEVISDEAVPTVYFSPTDISIQEGGRTTAALVSEGKQGAEVNTVKLAVDGNALVDLYHGATKLAPKDGLITVDLKDTNLARLSARSTSDRSLLDGQLKKKTWRITDADGANIDTEANTFTVTVEGSTAVPALPLVAQLLLALFLTAGGARLYRRRR